MTALDQSSVADEMLSPSEVSAVQRLKLVAMLREIRERNSFYRAKLFSDGDGDGDVSGADLSTLPFTTRAEIEADQLAHQPYGTNLTYPLEQYCRFHQTSGTAGHPVRWLDTAESWDWFAKCWGIIFRAAGVTARDRLMFPFSFGPFIGFWAAFEGAARLGCLCVPAGGLTTSARLKLIIDHRVDVVLCTPTYALRMAETAADEGIDLAKSNVRALIVAGEPGGSVPTIKKSLENAWGARVFDHNGMTEMGSVGYECQSAPGGLHIIESEFIAEVIDATSQEVLPEGMTGELVLTNLGRWGSPLIRYRTGDIVRLSRARCACGCSFARLEGGILSRLDDMFVVRGNNVFPTAVDAVLRGFSEIGEYRVIVRNEGPLAQVRLEIEPAAGVEVNEVERLAARVGHAVRAMLLFRAEVQVVPRGSLPRFEMKARRFVRE